MHIIANILWLVGVLYALIWGINIRHKAKIEQATEGVFEVHALLLAVSAIIIPVLSLSPLHLLWMFPVSFLLGLMSLIFPFSLLCPLASLYGSLWYIGIKNPGRAYYLAGDYTKAIESFKETIRLKPNLAEAHFNLGLAYGKTGDKQKELESYKEAIRLKPNSAEVHCNLGFTYRDLGNNQKAIESFKETIRIKPGYAKAHWNIGMVYVEVGDRESALKEYELLQKLDKNSADELYSIINAT